MQECSLCGEETELLHHTHVGQMDVYGNITRTPVSICAQCFDDIFFGIVTLTSDGVIINNSDKEIKHGE